LGFVDLVLVWDGMKREEISKERGARIYSMIFFEKIWRTLQSKVLTMDGDGIQIGTSLKKNTFELAWSAEYLCPAQTL